MRSRRKQRPNDYRLLKRLPLILTLVAILAATSCSTKKNTAFNRRYQAFTTKYNVYYNGIEHYKETLKDMETKYEDDYSSLVLMHPAEAKNYPKAPQPEGSFTRSIEKAQKAIQLHSIKKRPKRKSGKADAKYKAWLKREEFNPFIHNAWMLMGKSQYMNGDFLGAASTFYYISKHFTWLPETVLEAELWQSRSYSAMEWTYEAENLLVHVKPADLTTKKLIEAYNFAYADYYTKTADKTKAIPYLATAASLAKGSQKTRLNFLLGQLYALDGNRDLAYKAYGVAAGSNSAPYRTKFNARIKQSEVYAGKNIEPEVKALKRMTRYGRNKEYLDQIYYAIGNLYLTRNDTVHAVENYVLANEKSTRNGIDKAINNITLGGIYFDQHLYDKAQPCYTEALPQLPETYPNYEALKRRSSVLDELAVYSQNVTLQDSLLRLSAMTEEQQLKIVNKIIDDLKKKEKEEAEQAQMEEYLAKQGAAGNGLNQNAANAPKSFVMNSDNSWYFYNTSVRNAGKAEFQKRWGSRKLEDNWRRRNKSSFDMSDFDQAEADDNSEATDSIEMTDEERRALDKKKEGEKEQLAHEQDPHYPEFYLKQIPKTDDERQTSNDIIQEGLYNMGIILKDKLEDFPAAEAEFNRLLTRYPDNVYRLDVYYNIYLMMMRQGKTAKAETYRQLIMSEFPTSSYASAMADPNYFDALRQMNDQQEALYLNAYEDYLEGNNKAVHDAFSHVQAKYPLSPLMPKFMFINALTYVTERNSEKFQETLKTMLEKYPNTDMTDLATAYLKGLSQGRKLQETSSNLRGMIWSQRLTNDSTLTASDKPAEFALNDSVPHMVMFAYNTDTIVANKVLYDVARYNFTTYVVRDFDLQQYQFGNLGLLVVKGMRNMAEAAHYKSSLNEAKGLDLTGVRPIIISEDNFNVLITQGRSLEEYLIFVGEETINKVEDENIPESEDDDEAIEGDESTDKKTDKADKPSDKKEKKDSKEKKADKKKEEKASDKAKEQKKAETQKPTESKKTEPKKTDEPKKTEPKKPDTQKAEPKKPEPKKPEPKKPEPKKPETPAKPKLPDYPTGSEGDDDPLLN